MLRSLNTIEDFSPDLEGYESSLMSQYGLRDGFMRLRIGGNALEPRSSIAILMEPVLKLYADAHGSYVRSSEGVLHRFEGVWDALEWLLSDLEPHSQACSLPLAAGYLGYELLHYLEQVPHPVQDTYRMPLYLFYLYRRIHRIDEKSVTVTEVEFDQPWQPLWCMDDPNFDLTLGDLERKQGAPEREPKPDNPVADDGSLMDIANFAVVAKPRYLQCVRQIRELIEAGNVYQVNLSQPFSLPFSGSAPGLFKVLEAQTAPRYGAYLNVHEVNGFSRFSVLSASPELLLASNGEQLITSPIKGSIARSEDSMEDSNLREALRKSEKNLAELAMIVDLERNDLGRVSVCGSVEVRDHARIETLPYVHHLVSDVTAIKSPQASLLDVLKAIFPSGSITGAPKIAAMKWIAELEGNTRGVYTGAIGYFGGASSCQLNVAIRTGIVRADEFVLQAGGGIVIDSDPITEYEECLTKARGLYAGWYRYNLHMRKLLS